jgi:hypothetical protein
MPGSCLLLVAALQIPAAPARVRSIDFTAFDRFWRIADILSRDAEPSEADWRSMLETPAYRLVQTNLGPVIREAMEATFRPSRRADFARATGAMNNAGMVASHLARVVAERRDLEAFRDSLGRANVIQDAIAIAARYLPAGATATGSPPPVSAALFIDDGYSLPDGIVVDLLNVRHLNLAINLAHEFHHSYVNRMARPLPPGSESAPDAALGHALYDLRNEGIADQIDKPYPMRSPNAGLADYVAQYNAEYPRTPQRLAELDSLLIAVSRDRARMPAVSGRAAHLFWSNGHPNGAYIAREISETFGMDSLRAATRDPAIFLRVYASAERRHGRPDPFSTEAWSVIDELDTKYWRSPD